MHLNPKTDTNSGNLFKTGNVYGGIELVERGKY